MPTRELAGLTLYHCPICRRVDYPGCSTQVYQGFEVLACSLVPRGRVYLAAKGTWRPQMADVDFGDVHSAVKHFEDAFRFSHLPTALQTLSQGFAAQAQSVVYQLANYLGKGDTAHPGALTEVLDGLRLLLQAKDAVVRGAAMAQSEAKNPGLK